MNEEERKRRHREVCRRWKLKHPDYCGGRWRQDSELRKAYSHKYYLEHRDKIRRQQKQRQRNFYLFTGGKRHILTCKRPFVDYCEVCGTTGTILPYHHWDDNHLDIGIWLCMGCHKMAEAVDRGLHKVYLKKKREILCQFTPT